MIFARMRIHEVSFSEFQDMASNLRSILLGIHGKFKKPVKVGKHNCMDTMPAILSVLEQFGCRGMGYDDSLHVWLQRRQSKKLAGNAWSLDADGV